MDYKTLATLAFLDAFCVEQSLLTYFADLSGPALQYPAGRLNRALDLFTYLFMLPLVAKSLSTQSNYTSVIV